MIAAAAQTEHNLGFQLHLRDRAVEAEPFYRRAVALAPDFKEAWMNLGLAALMQKRLDEALLCQRTALRLDPDSADAQNNLGMVHYAQGNIAEAENCFRAALRLRPGHPNATLNLGSARQTLNHIEEAEALFRQAMTLGVDPARAKSNLALALMEQGRPEQAEVYLREALAERPDYAEARANLALALLTMGRLEEGFRHYESRWAVEAMGGPEPELPEPRWTGQALNGETVPAVCGTGVWRRAAVLPLCADGGGCRWAGRAGCAEGDAAGDDDAGRRGEGADGGGRCASAVRLSLPVAQPAVCVRDKDGDDSGRGAVSAWRSVAVGGFFERVAGPEGRAGVGWEVAHRTASCGGDRQEAVDAASGHDATA
jgi:Flp pilus assembly protein TadD